MYVRIREDLVSLTYYDVRKNLGGLSILGLLRRT